jgi:hypothetical protein
LKNQKMIKEICLNRYFAAIAPLTAVRGSGLDIDVF